MKTLMGCLAMVMAVIGTISVIAALVLPVIALGWLITHFH